MNQVKVILAVIIFAVACTDEDNTVKALKNHGFTSIHRPSCLEISHAR
jgi:hypothetical protein